jgi:hypothetical protein
MLDVRPRRSGTSARSLSTGERDRKTTSQQREALVAAIGGLSPTWDSTLERLETRSAFSDPLAPATTPFPPATELPSHRRLTL